MRVFRVHPPKSTPPPPQKVVREVDPWSTFGLDTAHVSRVSTGLCPSMSLGLVVECHSNPVQTALLVSSVVLDL